MIKLPPMPLSELQAFMYWIVTDPRGPEAIIEGAPDELSERLGGRDWRDVLAPRAGMTDTRRLDVYAGGYPTRIYEALTETYPSVKRVLGDQAFLSLAGRYAVRHPSRSYNLSAVGDQLPEFLHTDPLTGPLPFLPELAALDRAAMRAFHAWAKEPLDPKTLAAVGPERLGDCRFTFQPETVLMDSTWPIATIRELRGAPDAEFNVRVENNPERLVVHRTGHRPDHPPSRRPGHEAGYDVVVRRLEAPEHAALARLMAGGTVWQALEAATEAAATDAAAAEATAEPDGGSGLPVARWFESWVSSGLFSGMVSGTGIATP